MGFFSFTIHTTTTHYIIYCHIIFGYCLKYPKITFGQPLPQKRQGDAVPLTFQYPKITFGQPLPQKRQGDAVPLTFPPPPPPPPSLSLSLSLSLCSLC